MHDRHLHGISDTDTLLIDSGADLLVRFDITIHTHHGRYGSLGTIDGQAFEPYKKDVRVG